MKIEEKHLNDDVIVEYLTQLKIIDSRMESIRLEKTRLEVAKTVFANSLTKYMKDNEL
tara:strand:- start:1306 stop:1479 length:174 start_codon:yes stop_codon:yes gene_type:complete